LDDLEQRLNRAEGAIKRPSFRENKGLGNEVGYYVFDYPAEQELLVRERIAYIVNKNKKANDGFKIVVFDLYNIIIDILKKKGYLEKCYEFEKKKGFERITKSVDNMLRISAKDSLIIQHIKDNTPENSVVFLTGIGKCYPILRSHKVLNNLHQVIDKVPVVMFYPGKYDGQELILFSEIKDDNYYRAFKLVD
jgi:ribosomal protein S8